MLVSLCLFWYSVLFLPLPQVDSHGTNFYILPGISCTDSNIGPLLLCHVSSLYWLCTSAEHSLTVWFAVSSFTLHLLCLKEILVPCIALRMYLVLKAWSCTAIIIPSVSFWAPLCSHWHVSLLDISPFCLMNCSCMGFLYHSALPCYIGLSFVKHSSYAIFNHLSLLFFRNCSRALFLMLTFFCAE